MLSWHARVHADKAHLHLISGNDVTETVTYGALYEQAARVAEGLLAKGLELGAGAPNVTHGPGLLVFSAHCWRRPPVPIYPPGRPQQLESIFNVTKIAVNAGPVIMLTVPEALHFSKLMAAQVKGLRLITTVEDIVSESYPRPADHLATRCGLLQYTSSIQ